MAIDYVVEKVGSMIIKLKNGLSLRKHCLAKGINYHTIYKRITENNMTPESALKLKKYKRYFVEGMSLVEYCAKNKIKYNSVYNLIRIGVPIEEAVKKIKSNKRKKNAITNNK